MSVFSPQGHDIEAILSRMKQCITNGKLGRDYTIAVRDKNTDLRRKYYLEEWKIKEILTSLSVKDYKTSGYNEDRDFSEDLVHIFLKQYHLMPRFAEGANPVPVNIYIKFTWLDDKFLLFISLHESE